MSTIRQKQLYRICFLRTHSTGVKIVTPVYIYLDVLPKIGTAYSFGTVDSIEPIESVIAAEGGHRNVA